MNNSSHLGSSLQKNTNRGSVLLVALLLAIGIALALGSYVQLGRTTLDIANRSYYNNVAMNLAETGLENGIYSFNRYIAGNSSEWSAWTSSADSGDAAQKWDGFTYEGNNTGSVRVYVDNYTSANPALIARATITLPRGSPLEKWIQVTLTKRSKFDLGMVAKTITMSGGNVVLDSYHSGKGAYDAIQADGTKNRRAGITVGSTSLEDDTFNLSNSTVNGYVSVGTPDYDGLKLGPNAVIGEIDSTGIDYTRVNRDFRMDFDDEPYPADPTSVYTWGSINSTTTITAASAGTAGQIKTGQSTYKTVKFIAVSDITLSGGKSLTVGDASDPSKAVNLVILITKTSGEGVKVSGNSSTQIIITPGSSLAIYTEADVSIGGGGVANSGVPADFQVWGVKPQADDGSSQQNISISGNGNLSAVVYAPSADVTLNGGGTSGNVYGAVVGNTIKLNGGSSFHYDEALKDLDFGDVYRMLKWQELTSETQRSDVRAKLSF